MQGFLPVDHTVLLFIVTDFQPLNFAHVSRFGQFFSHVSPKLYIIVKVFSQLSEKVHLCINKSFRNRFTPQCFSTRK